MPVEEYNPLDYANLTKHCVAELMGREPVALGAIPGSPFAGSGVYALFYDGPFAPYRRIRSADASHPIYVGKAVPKGARTGRRGTARAAGPLWGRLREHHQSIAAATSTLAVAHFRVRFLVVTPLWITMAERFLIEHYQPIWNVCIEGFGNHDPGAGRLQGVLSWWDALHPGREWAARLRQERSAAQAQERLAEFLTAPPQARARLAEAAAEKEDEEDE